MKENLRTILRCTALAAVVIAALGLVPAAAEAQCQSGIHGVEIVKECVSPKNNCATDLDCSDGNACNGLEQCAAEGVPGSNLVDCTITITNPTIHCDDLTVVEACDTMQGATGSPSTSCDITVISASGGTGPGCDSGSDLGGAETCTLNPGESMTFRSNFYTLQPTDPDPLPDQATVTVVDTCSGSDFGCSTTPNHVQFTAATEVVTACIPGTPLVCDDGLFCTIDSCVPATGCTTTPLVCAGDGLFCNGTETCDETANACVPGPPVVCPTDNDACDGPEACDEATDSCISTGPFVDCRNAFFCSTGRCDPATGQCVAGTADNECDDQNECTVDECDEALDRCTNTDNVTPTCDENCEECDPTTGACAALDPAPAECVPGLPGVEGRMTGGGSFFTSGKQRVTHGFTLHCDVEVGSNNLEINWSGNHFHLEQLTSASCSDDIGIRPHPPSIGFDTYVGTGIGRCNGVDGATIAFTFTDAGEPGLFDTAAIAITGCPEIGGVSASGNLKKGNHQAHRE